LWPKGLAFTSTAIFFEFDLAQFWMFTVEIENPAEGVGINNAHQQRRRRPGILLLRAFSRRGAHDCYAHSSFEVASLEFLALGSSQQQVPAHGVLAIEMEHENLLLAHLG
jgi:hypothetical protein